MTSPDPLLSHESESIPAFLEGPPPPYLANGKPARCVRARVRVCVCVDAEEVDAASSFCATSEVFINFFLPFALRSLASYLIDSVGVALATAA